MPVTGRRGPLRPAAYYNEVDPYAAAWLRNLIAGGVIAPGDVDERSIEEVQPADLRGYAQCHFFAGIGIWSHALRDAGWPDDRPVWTGSCPCQPFSGAGLRQGFGDARHLWPAWERLIRELRPAAVFGEQVASGDGLQWFDLVYADLERAGYAVGAADICAAGFGAPHIRQRLYFVADAPEARRGFQQGRPGRPALSPKIAQKSERHGDAGRPISGSVALADAAFNGRGEKRSDAGGGRGRGRAPGLEQRSERGGLADAAGARHHGRKDARSDSGDAGQGAQAQGRGAARVRELERGGTDGELGNTSGQGGRRYSRAVPRAQAPGGIEGVEVGDIVDVAVAAGPIDGDADGPVGDASGERPSVRSGSEDGRRAVRLEGQTIAAAGAVGGTRGFWEGADWIWCRDEKYRPVEPGSFPLAHGAAARVGRLRAYGNALVGPVAAGFVKAYLETKEDR